MGEDARWVCLTCKTVCYRGGTPILRSVQRTLTVKEVDSIKTQFHNVMHSIQLVNDDADRYTSFLDDLSAWLCVHESHDIHVGSDYSTDMWDFEDYRVEGVDGAAHTLTIMEERKEREEAISKTEVKAISDMGRMIEEYADNKDDMSSEAVAKEILKKYLAFTGMLTLR